MNVYENERFAEYIQTESIKLERAGVNKSRFYQKDLIEFLEADDNKIFGLFDLRRTGR